MVSQLHRHGFGLDKRTGWGDARGPKLYLYNPQPQIAYRKSMNQLNPVFRTLLHLQYTELYRHLEMAMVLKLGAALTASTTDIGRTGYFRVKDLQFHDKADVHRGVQGRLS